MNTLYLASGSPRRQELLAQLGVTFERLILGLKNSGTRRKVRSSTFPVWRAKKRRLV